MLALSNSQLILDEKCKWTHVASSLRIQKKNPVNPLSADCLYLKSSANQNVHTPKVQLISCYLTITVDSLS